MLSTNSQWRAVLSSLQRWQNKHPDQFKWPQFFFNDHSVKLYPHQDREFDSKQHCFITCFQFFDVYHLFKPKAINRFHPNFDSFELLHDFSQEDIFIYWVPTPICRGRWSMHICPLLLLIYPESRLALLAYLYFYRDNLNLDLYAYWVPSWHIKPCNFLRQSV